MCCDKNIHPKCVTKFINRKSMRNIRNESKHFQMHKNMKVPFIEVSRILYEAKWCTMSLSANQWLMILIGQKRSAVQGICNFFSVVHSKKRKRKDENNKNNQHNNNDNNKLVKRRKLSSSNLNNKNENI